LALGNVHTWNRYNQRGNRENQEFVDLNDAVIAANGGAWDDPPERCIWTDNQLARARELVADLPEGPVLGFKDPRTLLTVDGWLEAVPELEFVGALRSPLAVAGSLAARNNMAIEDSIALWANYNRRLLKLCGRKRVPLVNFDTDGLDYLRQIGRLTEKLGLDALSSSEPPFFEESLRTANRRFGATRIPWAVRMLYWRLRRQAV